MIFIIRPFMFCCARRNSVTSRDPVRPCKAGLSRPSRKARRRFARGHQNAKGRMIFIIRPFMFWCPRRDSVTSRDPVRPCKAGLSRPSRKARRRFARGHQNAKGRMIFIIRPFMFWCPRRDSNPHTSRHMDLNHARLPIPPRGLRCKAKNVIIEGIPWMSMLFSIYYVFFRCNTKAWLPSSSVLRLGKWQQLRYTRGFHRSGRCLPRHL